jgi:hypothetical protein
VKTRTIPVFIAAAKRYESAVLCCLGFAGMVRLARRPLRMGGSGLTGDCQGVPLKAGGIGNI